MPVKERSRWKSDLVWYIFSAGMPPAKMKWKVISDNKLFSSASNQVALKLVEKFPKGIGLGLKLLNWLSGVCNKHTPD